MAFRDAYKISGSLVSYCINNNIVLEDVSLDTFREYSKLFSDDVYDEIKLEKCTFKRTSMGASAISSVEAQIDDLKKWWK